MDKERCWRVRAHGTMRALTLPRASFFDAEVVFQALRIAVNDEFSALYDEVQEGGLVTRSARGLRCQAQSARCHTHKPTAFNVGQVNRADIDR